jgi:hypothetical protein
VRNRYGDFGRRDSLENRNVLPDWNGDLQRVSGAFAAVILGQALAQPVGLHAHDGIRVLIKGWRTAEHLECDRVFLDVIGTAGELLLAKVGEEMSKGRRTSEPWRC